MAYSSYPYVSQATNDIEYSRLFREFSRSGVIGTFNTNGTDGTELSGTVGDQPLRTFLLPGSAILRGYYYRQVGNEIIQHDAGSSSPRYDRVVLRLDLNQAVGDRIRPVVLKGTAADQPTVPALTQTDTGIFEIPCYYVLIPAGATGVSVGNITPEKRYTYRVWTTERRPETPAMGRDFGYNVTTKRWEFWDGDSWEPMGVGTRWQDIAEKPTSNLLDGTSLLKGSGAPAASLGANGDVYLGY